ncbi:MFS transporter [Streptomyces sp. NBC_01433]|uniref:MFS transporter n=1 Tax=Streptomyces sp. NBC_01433 TaxID=2903864 RepID=UPI002250E2A6|nr:MFS transporter [Streptomyces sp. NBC_01433]MCX4675341.1 MFS transporter [Streptomyces sp. NBC_01433]
MKNFLTMVRGLPFAMKVLLASAAARSLSSFAILAYMPIYLYDTVGMDGATIGYVIGGSVLVGTLTAVYGGYLADRFRKVDLVIVLDLALILLYLSLTVFHDPVTVTAILLMANVASWSMGVAGSALLSELVPSENRVKVFSLRYSLQNIGAAVGPFLGIAALAAGPSGPFILSVTVIGASLLPLIIFRHRFLPAGSGTTAPTGAAEQSTEEQSAEKQDEEETPTFRQVLKVMGADRRLTYFTIGGILSIVVYGPLLTFMSQYLILVEDRDTAYKLVAYISAANAITVIGAQYALGSRLKQDNLLKWLTVGIGAFVVGLVAMSLSTNAAIIVIAVVIFSLGEVVLVPAEFTFIDSIAPDNLRGSYFGAQNLIHIGIALGPILCGFLLQHFVPAAMFYVLIGVVVASWWFYVIGCRVTAAHRGQVQAGAESVKAGNEK